MNKKLKHILQTSLAIILLLSFAPIFTTSASPEKPKISVIPKDNIFSTDPTAPNYKAVGNTFVVNVTAVDWPEPGVFALSFKLYYDNSILEAVSISPNADAPMGPPDHFMKPGLHWPPGTWTKGGLYVVAEGTGIWHADGYAALALTLTGTEPGHVGTGTIAQITFNITKEPVGVAPLTCNLELEEVTLSDPTPEKIPPETYDIENGYYKYSPPAPPLPWLKVEPEIVTAANLGDEVTVNVTTKAIVDALRIVSIEFKLRYNTTLLEVINVTEGDLLKKFGSTNFTTEVEYDYVLVNVTLMIIGPPFPSGSGTLATIKFNATYIPETITTSSLELDDVKLSDVDGNAVEYDHLESGAYQVPLLFKPEDLNQDGIVDVGDIAVWGKAFGSHPGHPRWDSRADLDHDGEITIIDAIKICKKFGT
jgi:hypothetical protein